MTALDKNALIGTRREKVELGDGYVNVISLSAGDFYQLMDDVADQPPKLQSAKLVEAAIVDDEGRPVFEPGDALKLDYRTFITLLNAANKMNGMNEESAAKN